nr:zinc finger, CCHC-type [Tanacetum cinerariifolium]
MASMNTRLNIKKLDRNIVQKHGGSKQVRFKQLGPGVETGVHGVHDEKRVGFEVEMQGAQGDCEAEVYTTMYKEWGRQTFGCCRDTAAEWVVDETNVTLFAKVVLYRNMGFNESGEYKKTFIGSGVGTGSMQVLHGFEFVVEPLGDHTFEVEPQENIDQGAGLQEVQTQDLMDYQLARDREQHLACELFGYREDSNEAAFAVAAVEKIYAHESLTFDSTVACEVISKSKAELKDDMDARSDVYVLSNVCRKCSDESNGYYWGYTPDKAKGNVLGMEIVRDQSGYTLRVSQSRFYNGKLVQTLLEGHSILSLEGSLSGDCDVEKNGKLSCIYAVRSHEYQMVCTILDIASVNVGYGLWILGCAGSLKANLQHMKVLSTTEADIVFTLVNSNKDRRYRVPLNFSARFHPLDVLAFSQIKRHDLLYILYVAFSLASNAVRAQNFDVGDVPYSIGLQSTSL